MEGQPREKKIGNRFYLLMKGCAKLLQSVKWKKQRIVAVSIIDGTAAVLFSKRLPLTFLFTLCTFLFPFIFVSTSWDTVIPFISLKIDMRQCHTVVFNFWFWLSIPFCIYWKFTFLLRIVCSHPGIFIY